jgi:elongation factor 2
MKVVDGAVVLLDAVSGIETQTTTVVRQALSERLKPVLVINKFDRFLHELKLEPEEAYQRCVKMIADVNSLISEYQTEDNKWFDKELTPSDGSVVFTCAYRNWGFDIDYFAGLYATKFAQTKPDMTPEEYAKTKETYRKVLWGDYYLDPVTKKPTTTVTDKRVWCEYIYKPMKNLYDAIMNGETEKITNILQNKFDTGLTNEESQLSQAELYKKVFKRVFQLAPVLKKLIVNHLPNPIVAQRYRVDVLYDGPLTEDDPGYKAIKYCDPNGPVMFFTSLMTPADPKDIGGKRFNAFGRLFSGTIRPGERMTIMNENYEYGKKGNVVLNKTVPRVLKIVASKIYNLDSAPAGIIIALGGIDDYLVKSGTVSSNTDLATLYPIKAVRFVVSPVVDVAIRVKNSQDIPKLSEGMRCLAKSDPIIKCTTNEDGENVISCVGELHAEISFNDLVKFCGCELIKSDPIVPLRETITEASGVVCLKKSSNKHNRLYMTAEPLPEELIELLESGEYSTRDMQKLSRMLIDKFGWDATDARKVWGLSPYDKPNCIFVDKTVGAQYLNEIKDGVLNGFNFAVMNGVLCDEPLRGVRINLVDIVLHADAIHRGLGVIFPASRDCVKACILANKPTLFEPVYKVTISTTRDNVGTIYSTLSYKRGSVINEEGNDGTPIVTVTGYLPVMESFGFDSFVKEKTSGQAFPSLAFSHWQPLDSKFVDNQITDTRKRKGLSETRPKFEDFNDKL